MKRHFFFKALVLALLLVSAFVNRVYAQYESFFGDSITQYNLAGECIWYDPLALGGAVMYYPTINRNDTVRINDKLYYSTDYELSYIHYCPYYVCCSYVREDTTTGQIFLAWCEDTPELCICDMSLSIGDTFCVPEFIPPIVADSIAFINGKKVIYFHQTSEAVYYCGIYGDECDLPIMFIEGIGPTYGPFGWDLWSNRACVLLCMYKDGEFVFALDEENLGCEQDPLVSVKENTSLEIYIYPNPARRNITVKLDDSFTGNGQIYVRDAIGRVLIAAKTNSKNIKLNLNNLQKGVYIITYIENNEKFSKKIIKE